MIDESLTKRIVLGSSVVGSCRGMGGIVNTYMGVDNHMVADENDCYFSGVCVACGLEWDDCSCCGLQDRDELSWLTCICGDYVLDQQHKECWVCRKKKAAGLPE